MAGRRACRRRRCIGAAAIALAAVLTQAGGAQGEPSPLTLAELSRMARVAPEDFPQVPGASRPILARFQGRKTSYAIGGGARQATLFIFRATNCSLPKKSIIDCSGPTGPGVYIPVLWVTPASRARPDRPSPPALILRSQRAASLADHVPELQDHTKVRSFWIRLDNPHAGSVNELDAPAVPAALVLCMPASECQNDAVPLANLADAPGPVARAATPPPEAPPAVSRAAVPAPVAAPPSVATAPAGPSSQTTDLMPGRWLLGLYGPQNIGVGIDASASVIADVQEQILRSLTVFLDDFHAHSFRSPAADLVLMTRFDASVPAFPEKNVIAGTSRRPRTGRLQLDHEGDRRLAAFLSEPGSAGAEASFAQVGETIRRYAQAAGDAAGQRPPIAVYVGAAHAHAESCSEWRKMTTDVASSLSGKPRVFGVVFANAGAGQIDEQLGRNGRGTPEAIAAGAPAQTCSGEGGSTLLFVSFPDLVAHTPENVLTQAFAAVRRRAEQVRN